MSERYVKVKLIMQKHLTASIMFTKSPVGSGAIWHSLPRSLIHGGDDLRLASLQHSCPVEVEFRLLAWKAKELNL